MDHVNVIISFNMYQTLGNVYHMSVQLRNATNRANQKQELIPEQSLIANCTWRLILNVMYRLTNLFRCNN